MTSYLLVVNPTSGRGRARSRAEVLKDLLGGSHPVELVETQGRGSAADLAAERASRVDRVIAVGGDGTLNEVVTGLLRSGVAVAGLPALGFLPSGTANAAVHAFGFGSDPTVLAESLPAATASAVDVGVVSHNGAERPFLLWFGAGFDAVVIETLNSQRTGLMGVTGLLRGVPRVLSAIGRYPAPDIEVTEAGGAVSRASSLMLANVGQIAFGGAVADTADPTDGLLDLVAVSPVPKWKLAVMGAHIMRSSLHRADGVGHALVSRVQLSSDGEVPFQLDGEPVGILPAVVRVVPGAVRLLLP